MYVAYETFIEVPVFQEISPALKNPWLPIYDKTQNDDLCSIGISHENAIYTSETIQN